MSRLIAGRRFEQVVRTYFEAASPGCTFERVVVGRAHRRGRLDVLLPTVRTTPEGDLVRVRDFVEIKCSDLDAFAARGTLARNLRRHIRQCDRYFEMHALTLHEHDRPDLPPPDAVQITLFYPHTPQPATARLVEEFLLDHHGINVMYWDWRMPKNCPNWPAWDQAHQLVGEIALW